MKQFSQHEEQTHILEYFKDVEGGRFLDIGSFHPETFSNVRGLYEYNNWTGICIEPSPKCYPAIRDFYKGTDVETYECAIGKGTGVIEFYEANGDALSSTDLDHVKKWEKGYGSKFDKITVQCFTLEDFLERTSYKQFNFVSIDVENDRLGIDILKQVDLYSVGMVCLEVGYDLRSEVKALMSGWREVYSNAENILLAR